MLKIQKDELTIYEVEALHKELIDESKNGDIVVDMSVVNTIDMSVIQLFLSANKSCLESSKTFKLINVNEELRKIFHNAKCEAVLGNEDE